MRQAAAELGVSKATAFRRLKQAAVRQRAPRAATPTKPRPPRARPTNTWQAPLTQALRAALSVAAVDEILAHVRDVLDTPHGSP